MEAVLDLPLELPWLDRFLRSYVVRISGFVWIVVLLVSLRTRRTSEPSEILEGSGDFQVVTREVPLELPGK